MINNITFPIDKAIAYYNIDIETSLSVNNLSYILKLNNNSNIIKNSLLFNIEDTSTLYNIFKYNDDKYSYNINNILFINNENKINQLSYNLLDINKFSINSYNNIEFNINNNDIQYKNGYICVNNNNLQNASESNKGLYKTYDILYLNSENKLSLNITNLDNLINTKNNIEHKLNEYNNALSILPTTNKYKKIFYNNECNIFNKHVIVKFSIDNDKDRIYEMIYKDKNITKKIYYNLIEFINNGSITDTINNYTNKCVVCLKNNLIVYDTDYFILDIPIYYEYISYLYNNYDIHKELCNILIQNINIQNSDNSISLDMNKSFVYDNKYDCHYYMFKLYKNQKYNIPVIRHKCRISLYFNINNIQENLQDLYELNFNIEYYYTSNNNIYRTNKTSLIFNNKIGGLFCIGDPIKNHIFKKLYHDYNHGFNYDKYGKCIGLKILNKNYVNKDNPSIITRNKYKFSNANPTPIIGSYDKGEKDIFVNFDEDNIDNIFVNNNILYTATISKYINKLTSFNKFVYFNSEQRKITSKDINNYITNNNIAETINEIDIPINKKNNQNNIIYDYTRNIKINNNNFIIYNINGDEILPYICLYNKFYGKINYYIKDNEENQKIVNKPYNLIDTFNNNELINIYKDVFSNIYNYRKSGLLNGDFYVPSINDYCILRYFNFENYFNNTIYNQYVQNINKYEFISNQFFIRNSNIYNYYITNNYKISLQPLNAKVINKEISNLLNNLKTEIYNILIRHYKYCNDNSESISIVGNKIISQYLYMSKLQFDNKNWFFTGDNTTYHIINNEDNRYSLLRRILNKVYTNNDLDNNYNVSGKDQNTLETYNTNEDNYLLTCSWHKELVEKISLYNDINNSGKLYDNVNYTNEKYTWPFFKLPDFSIINSENYSIIFNEKDNCEYINYYIDNYKDPIYINFKDYKYANTKYFYTINKGFNASISTIFDDNSLIDNNSLIDKDNNIYQMKIKISNIINTKIENILTIYYIDSEQSMNRFEVVTNENKTEMVRILCKVCIKFKQ